jgi:DNA helicase-2/ATP-dependent DNA helicase PcrA
VALAQDALSDAFSSAVGHPGRRLVVLGAAGTGKSTLLVARFQALVRRGLAPERILLLAPTPARARTLQRSVEEELERGCELVPAMRPVELASRLLGLNLEAEPVLGPADRLAMLLERIDELSLRHHDIGGNLSRLLGELLARIDRCKAELIGAEEYAAWAAALPDADDPETAAVEREFAELYLAHERMVAEAGTPDEGELVRRALRAAGERPGVRQAFAHVLIDDAHELDLAAASLATALADGGLTVAGDPGAALLRFRGAGQQRLESFCTAEAQVIVLERSWRCPERVRAAAGALTGAKVGGPSGGELCFWASAGERAQAQSVAADIERLIAREHVSPGRIAVLVPSVMREGRALAVALEERAIPHRLIGEAAFFQRAEIRDVLAWLRLLADPTDAAAVVRALARAPVELRSVDIARCVQIARRRKLDMVAALAAATESPQVPPEARERIRVFLKLYRSAAAAIDTTRPDLYVHRLIERLGLRRQQLFAAQADVVERLRALARFGELAAEYARREPHGGLRGFARRIAAIAEIANFGPPALGEQEEPELAQPAAVQVMALQAAGGLEADHVYVLGLGERLRGPSPEPIPDALLHEPLPDGGEPAAERLLRQALYVAISRAAKRVVLCCPVERDGVPAPCAMVGQLCDALGERWEPREEELFGPAETLHSTYRMARDELLEGTMRAGGRLGELRFDTDLDVAHAVVRYLELLKLAALIARPEGQPLAEALRDVNARILQAVSAEQREIFSSSALDEYLLDSERDAGARAQAIAARDEPSLQAFLPLRGEGVVLSASDIDTYRICPLKYKFARVFRIPAEPTVHQRFGIVVHQVLERFHAGDCAAGSLAELLGLLESAWRRGGFGDSEEERQLRGKAAGALTRYHERFRSSESEPLWFERQFSFRLGAHLVRGRVDRVDRLADGGYELIDYKTGRPRSEAQLAEDVQLSLYALGAREAWALDGPSQQAYYYLLDDRKVRVPGGEAERAEWIRAVVEEVAAGIRSQGFEPTPSYEACSLCDYRLVCPAAER